MGYTLLPPVHSCTQRCHIWKHNPFPFLFLIISVLSESEHHAPKAFFEAHFLPDFNSSTGFWPPSEASDGQQRLPNAQLHHPNPAPALPPPNLMVHPTAQPRTGAPVERGPAAKVFFDKGEPHSRLQNVKFSCIEPMVPDGPCVPGPGCHPPSLPPLSCLTPDASVVLTRGPASQSTEPS